MKKIVHQLKTSFHMSDRQMGNYNKVLDIMTAKNINPAQGKTFSQSDVMKFCLDNFFDGNNNGR